MNKNDWKIRDVNKDTIGKVSSRHDSSLGTRESLQFALNFCDKSCMPNSTSLVHNQYVWFVQCMHNEYSVQEKKL